MRLYSGLHMSSVRVRCSKVRYLKAQFFSLTRQIFSRMFLFHESILVKYLAKTCQFRQLLLLVSQAAACDGMIYSVNYNGQNSVTQGYALPLFED